MVNKMTWKSSVDCCLLKEDDGAQTKGGQHTWTCVAACANNCNGIRKEEWKERELSHVYLYNLALHSNGSSSDLGVGCDC